MPANFWGQRGAQPRPQSQGTGTHVAAPGSDGAHLLLPDSASGPVTAAGSPGHACSGDMTQLTRQAVGEEGQQMGEEGEQECLSQHNPLPTSFQGSCCWHPECGSRQWLRAPCEPGPALPSCPGIRRAHATPPHPPPLCPVGKASVQLQPHQEPISEGALAGKSAFLGSCSASKGSGDSCWAFPGPSDGNLPTPSAASKTENLLSSPEAPPSPRALVPETGLDGRVWN